MDNLYIQETTSSPSIDFNAQTHIHSIKGDSYPDHLSNFYDPITIWLENYIENLNHKATFNVELRYFNSSSSKVLIDIFDAFDEAVHDGKEISVNWIFEDGDEAIEEYGEEFAEDMEHLEFNIVAKQ
ncbi:MAG: DUF1987 domain-containing protein [Campylobacterota bacterium]|nr:DUF1987 domain-containing protein [Campylobacterota bacterium]